MREYYKISIKCEYENLPAIFAINIVGIEENAVQSRIVISTYIWEFQSYCYFLGYDILKFINELEKIYKYLDGKANLINFSEEIIIHFEVFEKGSGRIIIGGQIYCPVLLEYVYPSLPNTEIKFTFSGLITDQSYLPEFIQALKDFLIETGISVQSPWES